MPELKLGKNDIKTLLSPDGALQLKDSLKQLFSPGDAHQPVSVTFSADPSKEVELGTAGNIKLGLEGGMKIELLSIWPNGDTKPLEPFGLQNYFADVNNSDKFFLLLTAGADVDANGSIDSTKTIFSAGATFKAGADGTYAMIQPFQKDTPAADVWKEFFSNLRFPSEVTEVPEEGEVIQMEYGGNLSFGANLGVGYEVVGTPSLKIGGLKLSERYKLSLMGKLGFDFGVKGRFNIDVRKAERPNWAHVKVSKSKNKKFQIAAGVEIVANNIVEGLPESPREFLGVTLGLKAQNWLNLFEEAKKFTNFKELDDYLDNLAKAFIEKWTGKVFDELKDNKVLEEVTDKINKVVDSYEKLDDQAIKLFDHFYDKVDEKLNEKLIGVLEDIEDFTSLDQLKDSVLGDKFVTVIYILTDGDPLGWLQEKVEIKGKEVNSLEELKNRAKNVLSLIKDEAHKEIRKIIELAKSEFHLDKLINEMKSINPDKVEAKLKQKLTGFSERVIGKLIDKTEESEFGKVVKEVNNTLNSIGEFSDNLYGEFKKALNQSLEMSLRLGYERTKADTALLDVEINLANDNGKELMKAVGRGNFDKIFKNPDPKIVRINKGELIHQVTRKSTLAFNIVGWHTNFKYKSVTQLLTNSKQHIETNGDGLLTVCTNIKLMLSKDKIKNRERICTNMILAFAGTSNGAVEYDEDTKRFLVNTITKMSGKYKLSIDDKKTTPKELDEYLKYAEDFGIREKAEAKEALIPAMEKNKNGNYDDVSLFYEVRFSEEGLEALFNGGFPKFPEDEEKLRGIIRELTLINYNAIRDIRWRHVGWIYWIKDNYDIWKQLRDENANFWESEGLRNRFTNSTFAKPPNTMIKIKKKESVSKFMGIILDHLYSFEDDIVEAFSKLKKTFQDNSGLQPQEYEKRLEKLGKALQRYDRWNKSIITFFAFFDRLIKASGNTTVNNSGLTLKSKKQDCIITPVDKEDKCTTTQMLFSQ
jgi:hypothetical protein